MEVSSNAGNKKNSNTNSLWTKDYNNIDLVVSLENSIKFMNNYNPYILSSLFNTSYNEMNFIVRKLLLEHNSEILVSYGLNYATTKVLTESLINYHLELTEFQDYNIKRIDFNAYIHSTEEYIFNEIVEALGIKEERGNFHSYQKILETHFEKLNKKVFKYKNSNDYIENNLDAEPVKPTKNKKKNNKNNINIDFKKPMSTPKDFLVIYFHNIEHLFVKKKQTLFYTLLEILNKSCNVLFIGMTNTFNLVDLMEKRVRSRFSHKLYQVTIDKKIDIFNTLGIILNSEWIENNYDSNDPTKMDQFINSSKNIEGENSNNNDSIKQNTNDDNKSADNKSLFNKSVYYKDNVDPLNIFRMALFDNKDFCEKLRYYFDLGISGVDMLTRVKFILSNILFELKKRMRMFVQRFPNYKHSGLEENEKNEDHYIINGKKTKLPDFIPISFEEMLLIIKIVVGNYITSETKGGEYKLLKDFPKIHLLSLISLYVAKTKYKEKISLNLIYQEYTEYCRKNGQSFKIDSLQIKKKLEELRNSNLIAIKSDEKFTELYDLKVSTNDLRNMLLDLYKDNSNKSLTSFRNFDMDMHKWLLEFSF